MMINSTAAPELHGWRDHEAASPINYGGVISHPCSIQFHATPYKTMVIFMSRHDQGTGMRVVDKETHVVSLNKVPEPQPRWH